MGDPSFNEANAMVSSYQEGWRRIQDQLKGNLLLKDDFAWSIPSNISCLEERVKAENLQYIGGVDVSFSKGNASLACGALVVLDAYTLEVVHEDYEVVHLDIPYIPGFLAFREAPILLGLLDKMKRNAHPYYPQVLMVDGNGLLHPRGFGLACHLGVMADLPTIGIGKSLHHVDGLTQSGVRQHLDARENIEKDLIPLIGKSGNVWGMVRAIPRLTLLLRRRLLRTSRLVFLWSSGWSCLALRSTTSSSRPVYISMGHRISLDSSVRVVRLCCKFRVPEPIRMLLLLW